MKKHFIFYGGTAIKRIYFEDHRFSEDIDLLSTHHFSEDYLLQTLDALKYAQDKANLDLKLNKDQTTSDKDRIKLIVTYSGYEEIIGAKKEIHMDFSRKEDLYGDTEEHTIIKSYSDIKPKDHTLHVMSLNSILANKLGMLTDNTRNEPRDLFDIWFLMNRVKEFNFDLEKVKYLFKKRCGFNPSMNTLTPYLQEKSFKTSWNKILSHQIADLPDLEMVINDVKEKLGHLLPDE